MNTNNSNSGNRQVQFNGKVRSNKMWTSIKDLAEVKVRKQHMKDEIHEFTEIGDLGDGKTVVVYTEDIALHDRLVKWEQCQFDAAFGQTSGPDGCHLDRIGFELCFPKRMKREFQHCGIRPTNGKTGFRSCFDPLECPDGQEFHEWIFEVYTQRKQGQARGGKPS